MKNILHNLRYRADGEEINPLAHLFFAQLFIFGFFYTFLNGITSVQQSILYIQSRAEFGHITTSAWGILAIIASILNMYTIARRKRRFATWGILLGFMLWVYALLLYSTHGYWFQFAVSIPNLFFWGIFYVRLLGYQGRFDSDGAPVVR